MVYRICLFASSREKSHGFPFVNSATLGKSKSFQLKVRYRSKKLFLSSCVIINVNNPKKIFFSYQAHPS